jgi:hypothetical protein
MSLHGVEELDGPAWRAIAAVKQRFIHTRGVYWFLELVGSADRNSNSSLLKGDKVWYGNVLCHTYIHNITPVSLWGRQRSLPFTCYDPYKHLSLSQVTSLSQLSYINEGIGPGQDKRIATLSFLHGCHKRRLKDLQHSHLDRLQSDGGGDEVTTCHVCSIPYC